MLPEKASWKTPHDELGKKVKNSMEGEREDVSKPKLGAELFQA